MTRFGKLVVLVILLSAIGGAMYYYIHKRAQSGRLELLDAEYSYLTTLQGILQKQHNPESQNDISAFVSANSLNSLLSGADGTTISLPNAKGTILKLNTVRSDFRDGFPGVLAKVSISRQNPAVNIDADLYCVLEPKIDVKEPTSLLLFIRPLYLNVGSRASTDASDAARTTENLLGDIAAQYTESIPHLAIPLAHEFSTSFPASNIPLSIPTPAGMLHGELDIPGLFVHSAVNIAGVLFLSDGIHIFLSANAIPKNLFPYQDLAHRPPYLSDKALAKEINEKESQIRSVRESLQTLTVPLKVINSDFRIWISKSAISLVADVFNSLTPAERRIHYHTVSTEGQLYRMGGGGAGCGGYAELVGGNSANADLQVSNLVGAWTNEGLTESADFQFSFDAQLTGHVNGPAGPHTYWVTNCYDLFHQRVCLPPVPSVTISCETPVGGGVGLGSYGVHGNRTERLTATMTLHSDPSSWLIYDLAVTSPDQVPITVEVGLGQLGAAGFPIIVGVPHQSIISGKAPTVFGQDGILEDPASHLSKKYIFTIAPTAGAVQGDGYAAVGKLNIQWQ